MVDPSGTDFRKTYLVMDFLCLMSFLFCSQQIWNFNISILIFVKFLENFQRKSGVFFTVAFLILFALYIFVILPRFWSFEESGMKSSYIFARILVFILFSFRFLLFSFCDKQEEEESRRSLREVESLADDENDLLRRLSQFSQIGQCGASNGLDFLKKALVPVFTEKRRKAGGRTSPFEEKCLKNFESIETTCQYIGDQTEDILRYNSIRNGSFTSEKPKEDRVNLLKLIESVIEVQKKIKLDRVEGKKECVRLHVRMDTSKIPKRVIIDRKDTRKVISNILSNALKYTNEGSVTVHVDILDEPPNELHLENNNNKNNHSKEEEEEHVYIKKYLLFQVLDTGIGMEANELSTIYRPFEENHKDKESFSVGLVIAKGIVDRVKGCIDIHSEGLDKGTLAKVLLPFRLSEENEEEEMVVERPSSLSSNMSSADSNQIGAATRMRNKKKRNNARVTDILIIEDNPLCQTVIKKLVQKSMKEAQKGFSYEYNIHVVENGKDALEFLYDIGDGVAMKDFSPLILCDYDMPIMKGTEFCQTVRSLEGKNRDLVIYLVSAATDELCGPRQWWDEKYGFDGYIPKPLNITDFRSIFQNMIQIRYKRMKMKKYEEDFPIEEEEGELEPPPTPLEEKEKRSVREKEEEDQLKRRKIMEDMKFQEEIDKEVSKKRNFLIRKKGIIITLFMIIFNNIIVGLFYLSGRPSQVRKAWASYNYIFLFASVAQVIISNKLIVRDDDAVSKDHLLTLMKMMGSYFFFPNTMDDKNNILFLLGCVILANDGTIFQSSKKLPMILTFFCILQKVYHELISSLVFPINNNISSTTSFSSIIDHLRFFQILIFFLFNVFVMLYEHFLRMRLWAKLVARMKREIYDNSLTISKISHDITVPVTALVIYLDELKFLLLKNRLIELEDYTTTSPTTSRSRENKNIIFSNYYHTSKKQLQIFDDSESESEPEEDDDMAFIMNPDEMTEEEFRKRSRKRVRRRKRRNGKLKKIRKEVYENYRIMMKSSLGLETSIQDFLNYCKIRTNRVRSLKRSSVSIRTLITEILDHILILKPPWTTLSFKFEDDDDDGDDEEKLFRMDHYHFRMILTNILANAFVHSEAHRIVIKVRYIFHVSDSVKKKMVEVIVQDDGKGIPIKILEELRQNVKKKHGFQFMKGKYFNVTLGLGIMLSKCLSESTQSTIRYNNNKQQQQQRGTFVCFQYPIEENNNDDNVRLLLEQEQEQEETEEEDGEIIIKKSLDEIRVLILDDHPMMAKFCEKYMRRLGFVKILTFTNSDHLLQEMIHRKHDILLSDFKLERKKTILDILEKKKKKRSGIRSNCSYYHPKVVTCVTSDLELLPTDVVSEYFDDVLGKPIKSNSDLKLVLKRFIRAKLK